MGRRVLDPRMFSSEPAEFWLAAGRSRQRIERLRIATGILWWTLAAGVAIFAVLR